MKILCIETTCDETAAAIITQDLDVLSSIVATQDELHEHFNGVVPEIAARAHVERILPVIHQAIKAAQLSLKDLDAIAVANTPGLSGSLLVGLVAAKSLCLATGLPLIAINHLHAHIYAAQIGVAKIGAAKIGLQQSIFPCVGMIVSGGHTHLYRYDDALSPKYLGGTIDDAAGEAFDKVASMLGLPYPGGPAISLAAKSGSPDAFKFPRSFIHDDRLDFSFSGLKTAVRYAIAGSDGADPSKVILPDSRIADLCASFQQAVVDVLITKAIQAIKQTGLSILCVGGGVAANRELRSQLSRRCEELDVELHIAPLELCTDNAIMGAIAVERFQAGLFENLDLDIKPGLVRH